jgi:hypothetical protein
MLELTVMGGSCSHLGPRETDAEEAPHIGATPRHRRGFFPRVHHGVEPPAQREGPLEKELRYEKVIRHFCERFRAGLGDVCASQSIRPGR